MNPYTTTNSSSSIIPNAGLSNTNTGYSIMPSSMESFGGSASNLVAYTGSNKMNSFQGMHLQNHSRILGVPIEI